MINFKEIDAILFDFGGTLDTNGIHWSEKFWEVYERFNVPINYELFREAYIIAEPKVQKYINKNDNFLITLKTQISLQINYLIEKGVKFSESTDEIVSHLTKACYNDVVSNISDIKPILNSLKSIMNLGLVSNFYGNVKSVCRDLEIDSYFDIIIDSAELKISKPNPQIFKTAIDTLGVIAEKTIVIGDSYDRDIVPAKQLGCKTIWLEGKSWKKQEYTVAADITINSLSDLEEYFKKIDKIKK